MRTKASLILGALLAIACTATTAYAVQYPPGPAGCAAVSDTSAGPKRIEFVQNPTLNPGCFPVPPDTVWGVTGIITGFDPIPTGFAIYVQNSDGNPWGGLDLFTGGTNYQGLFTPALAMGDSLIFYGRMDEFQGETEIRGFASSPFGAPLPAVRRISTGNPLPPFKRGSVNYFRELNTNPNAEQWEGCLVRAFVAGGKMRVVRTSATGGMGTNNSFLAVDNVICPSGSVGPCDSLLVDGSTLAAIAPPPVGALVDSVQGIYNERTRGYRIQLRDGQDLFDSSPPSLLDAFPIANGDTIRVIFDRNLTLASAQNVLNYTLTSNGFPVDAAVRQANNSIVHCKITNALAAGDPEGITVNGVVNAGNGVAMTVAATRNFFNGILPIGLIQAPDATAIGGSPCEDRSKFAAPGNQATGGRMTTRGVCTAAIGSTYWLETAGGGTRSGIAIFAPIQALTVGRQYLVAGGIQEFFGETEVVFNVFLQDEGAVAVPAPVNKTITALRDTTCDSGQSLDTGEDYEGMLVRILEAKTTEERTAGQSWFAAGPYPSAPDTILIDNDIARTFDPTINQWTEVTGIQDVGFEAAGTIFRIQPRGNADIVVNTVLGVDGTKPTKVSLAVSPNPGRTPRVTFAVPRRDHVSIGVYDLAGRRLTTLVNREFEPGTYSVDWTGQQVGAGVYFYKMTVGSEVYSTRAVRIE